MKKIARSFLPFLPCFAAAALVAACSGATSTSADSTPSGASAAAAAADVTGTWRFALESSDVAARIRRGCGDDAACFDRIATQAKNEKIRFTRDVAGKTVWTSFETVGAEEHVFLEAPIELTPNGGRHLSAKVVGAPSGLHADRFAKSGVKLDALDVEIVDPHTIALTDPKKGRLVYTKE